MKLDIRNTFVVEFTNHELRLVMAALKGDLKPEWQEDARRLQNDLFNSRNTIAKNQLSNIDVHEGVPRKKG